MNNISDRKIHCFGDSWTFGIGSEVPPNSTILTQEEKHRSEYNDVRKIYSWPGVLESKVNLPVHNEGDSGISNNLIYNYILKAIYSDKIKSGDIVIVMWASVLREPLNFFNDIPGSDTHQRYVGLNDIKEILDDSWIRVGGRISPPWAPIPLPKGFDLNSNINNLFKEITFEVYKDYILNRLSYNFLYEICMNYICNLQIYFSKLNINYVFLNAFDSVLSKDHPLYNLINLDKWIMSNSHMHHFLWSKMNLIDKNLPYSYWEDDKKNVGEYPSGVHPNRIGYNLIGNEIYNFMVENNYEI